jgi:hypothetical protein
MSNSHRPPARPALRASSPQLTIKPEPPGNSNSLLPARNSNPVPWTSNNSNRALQANSSNNPELRDSNNSQEQREHSRPEQPVSKQQEMDAATPPMA